MGVFDRFERRIERAVEGTFAKVFKDEAEPADIARALQRESDDRRVVVGQGRVLAPNTFVVALGDHDYTRLSPYEQPLEEAFAEMLRDHAVEQGYSLAGAIRVDLEHESSLDTGRFEVRSVPAGTEPEPKGGTIRRPEPPLSATTHPAPLPKHRLVISNQGSAEEGTPQAQGADMIVPITDPVTIIGRAASADLRLDDPGVSRRHAELRLADETVRIVDVGSTNGTAVNGQPIAAKELNDGDRIKLGNTILVYHTS